MFSGKILLRDLDKRTGRVHVYMGSRDRRSASIERQRDAEQLHEVGLQEEDGD